MVLAADGRCDSPGNSTKYNTPSPMDIEIYSCANGEQQGG